MSGPSLRTLQVVPTYLPAVRYGGPIHSVHGLCRALAAGGHEAMVATTNVDGNRARRDVLQRQATIDGVHIRYFGVPFLRRLYFSPGLRDFLAAETRRFDLVHLHSVFLWPTLGGARAARRARVPYVLTPRGMLVRDLIRRRGRLRKSLWIRLFERRTLRRAALVHLTSEKEKDELRNLGLGVERTVVIPNGVDLPGAAPSEADLSPDVAKLCARGPFVLAFGRIYWKKGLDRLLRAATRLPQARLVIAGNDDDGYASVLRALAAELGIAEQTQIVDRQIEGADKEALLRSAALLVLPSYSENFGNVVLEAMVRGTPVVVTPEVGAAAIVEQGGGGLVVEGDPEALANGIRNLFESSELRANCGRQGRDFVTRKLSWDAVAEQMLDAYREVIARGRAGAERA